MDFWSGLIGSGATGLLVFVLRLIPTVTKASLDKQEQNFKQKFDVQDQLFKQLLESHKRCEDDFASLKKEFFDHLAECTMSRSEKK